MHNNPPLAVTLRPRADLRASARNPRTHSQAQVRQLAESLKAYGWTNPVLVSEEGEVVAGHGRLAAADLLWAEGGEIRNVPPGQVPCIALSGMSAAERRAYLIADNQFALQAGWDESLLALELGELKAEGFELSFTGFDSIALDRLLGTTPGLTHPDETPELPRAAVSRPGEMYRLGRHRLLCGDSTDPAAAEALMGGLRADCIFTDPTWNVNYGAVEKGNAQGYVPRTIKNDHLSEADWADFVAKMCAVFRANSKHGAPIYVIMSPQEWPVVDKGLRDAGFHWSSTIIWTKDALVLSRKDYHTQYEPMWYGWNDGAARLVKLEDRKQSDVWAIERPRASAEHPTMKPIELVARAIANSTKPDSIVADFFGGAGSTIIACEQEGRTCYTMEIEPKYVDVTIIRWQNFTGQRAIRESDGLEFNCIEPGGG